MQDMLQRCLVKLDSKEYASVGKLPTKLPVCIVDTLVCFVIRGM